MPTLGELLRAIRPVFHETDLDDTPYWGQGTAVLVSYRGAQLHGEYVGESVSDACGQMRVFAPAPVAHFSGFSGSPVLAVPKPETSDSKVTFRGIVIRGGAGASVLHFVDAAAVFKFFAKAITSDA